MITLNSKKRQQGFTLVEVIVVAIIVAALAAVAVPMYTSYVDSSRENAAANAAGSVASFMGACINQGGDVTPSPVAHDGDGSLTLTCSAGASMQLPDGINITAKDGVVTAFHLNFTDGVKTYNYGVAPAAGGDGDGDGDGGGDAPPVDPPAGS